MWLICWLEFNGRRREVMGPSSYTELFFLDEAVALAAVTARVVNAGAGSTGRSSTQPIPAAFGLVEPGISTDC